MADFDALLDEAELPERTVSVCLRGKLRAEWELLNEQLSEAQQRERSSMSDDGGQAVAEQMAELEERMRAGTVTVRLRALGDRDGTPGRTRFNRLVAEHPPRDDNRLDATLGVNKDTFFDALIPLSVVDVTAHDGDVHVPDDAWVERMLTRITARQFDDLANAAFLLNGGGVDVPFSPAASRLTRDSAATSKQRSGSGSASGGSTGGSRKKSRSTSTTTKGGSSGR